MLWLIREIYSINSCISRVCRIGYKYRVYLWSHIDYYCVILVFPLNLPLSPFLYLWDLSNRNWSRLFVLLFNSHVLVLRCVGDVTQLESLEMMLHLNWIECLPSINPDPSKYEVSWSHFKKFWQHENSLRIVDYQCLFHAETQLKENLVRAQYSGRITSKQPKDAVNMFFLVLIAIYHSSYTKYQLYIYYTNMTKPHFTALWYISVVPEPKQTFLFYPFCQYFWSDALASESQWISLFPKASLPRKTFIQKINQRKISKIKLVESYIHTQWRRQHGPRVGNRLSLNFDNYI